MSRPRVYELTSTSSHHTSKTTAMVYSIRASAVSCTCIDGKKRAHKACGRASRAVIGICASALVGGCQTPVTTDGRTLEASRTTYTLRHEPHRAAACLARNVDWHSTQLVARIRPGKD